MDWDKMHTLMVDAGLLFVTRRSVNGAPEEKMDEKKKRTMSTRGRRQSRELSNPPTTANLFSREAIGSDASVLPGTACIDPQRMAAMLALTCIHDIMKLEVLCPAVLAEHAPFHGVGAGETIHDHDLALAYILEHDPTSLPSFNALPEAAQRSVAFTQADLGFNHGWLVQAEAPPGTIFKRFKQLLTDGQVEAEDISFYFVHWLTDLAGAEPTPLRGCEKFVLKFPRSVLDSILGSLPFVQRLATTTPTALYENYLNHVWPTAIGPPPEDDDAVAMMRLLVQVQEPDMQELLWEAQSHMAEDVRSFIAYEMALSGVRSESYTRAPNAVGGPAFLVYYSPAYLRHCCVAGTEEAARDGLVTLAEVYRAARALWPLVEGAESETVTIMVDELRACNDVEVKQAYLEGQAWLLERTTTTTGSVRRKPLAELPALLGGGSCELLRLWSLAKSENRPFPPGGKQLQLAC